MKKLRFDMTLKFFLQTAIVLLFLSLQSALAITEEKRSGDDLWALAEKLLNERIEKNNRLKALGLDTQTDYVIDMYEATNAGKFIDDKIKNDVREKLRNAAIYDGRHVETYLIITLPVFPFEQIKVEDNDQLDELILKAGKAHAKIQIKAEFQSQLLSTLTLSGAVKLTQSSSLVEYSSFADGTKAIHDYLGIDLFNAWQYKKIIGDVSAGSTTDKNKYLDINVTDYLATLKSQPGGLIPEWAKNCSLKEGYELLDKYQQSPLLQNATLKEVILDNPCMLFTLKPLGAQPQETPWMKDFNRVVGAAVAIAVVPAAAEILGPALAVENGKKKIGEFAVGTVVDGALQVAISHWFFDKTFQQSIDEVDKWQMVSSGFEALYTSNKYGFYFSLGQSCLFDGLTQDGEIDPNLTTAKFTEDCVKGVVSALLVNGTLSLGGKTVQKLKSLAAGNSEKFIGSLLKLGFGDETTTAIAKRFGLEDASIKTFLRSAKSTALVAKLKNYLNDVDLEAVLKKDLDDSQALYDALSREGNEKLVEAWRKMKTLNADDVLRKNPGALEALSKPKGSRPDPSTYLDATHIDNHLKNFEGGVTKITSYIPSGTVGPPGGTFVLPKSKVDDLISQSAGDITKLEYLLGLNKGDLGTNPYRVDMESPSGLRMPDGNEPGANEFWIPGGKTSGGTIEATIDQIQPGTYMSNPIFK